MFSAEGSELSNSGASGPSRGIRRMVGRDTRDTRRASSPLELLFDLTFVIAFGQAADQLANHTATGDGLVGVAAFAFAMFAICWAWFSFTWFASAFDTDDWLFRVATMVQMIGVVVLALGIPEMFHSLAVGERFDNRVMVAGYVVMRVAIVGLWVRVALQDPPRRKAAVNYAAFVTGAQIGWIALALAQPSLATVVIVAILLFAIEVAGPALAEARFGGTPWNAHHVVERFGLLTIVALGEVLFGTVTSVAALVEKEGWSLDAILVVVAGVGLTFGLWWSYFVVPSAEILAQFRRRAPMWGYSHILIFSSIAATGAGLQVAGFVIDDHSQVGAVGAVLAIAFPLLLVSMGMLFLHTYLLRAADLFTIGAFFGTAGVLAASVALASWGAPLGVSLVILTLSPLVYVLGYELVGNRRTHAATARALSESDPTSD